MARSDYAEFRLLGSTVARDPFQSVVVTDLREYPLPSDVADVLAREECLLHGEWRGRERRAYITGFVLGVVATSAIVMAILNA